MLRQPSQKFWPKIVIQYIFYSNFYLHFLRSCCVNIFKIVGIVSEKIGKYISQFPILFLPLCDMVSICLIRKGKYNWFLYKGLLFDWPIFLLYLLQFFVVQNILPRQQIFLFLNLFHHFLHLFVHKHLRIFVTVMQSNFTAF